MGLNPTPANRDSSYSQTLRLRLLLAEGLIFCRQCSLGGCHDGCHQLLRQLGIDTSLDNVGDQLANWDNEYGQVFPRAFPNLQKKTGRAEKKKQKKKKKKTRTKTKTKTHLLLSSSPLLSLVFEWVNQLIPVLRRQAQGPGPLP